MNMSINRLIKLVELDSQLKNILYLISDCQSTNGECQWTDINQSSWIVD